MLQIELGLFAVDLKQRANIRRNRHVGIVRLLLPFSNGLFFLFLNVELLQGLDTPQQEGHDSNGVELCQILS